MTSLLNSLHLHIPENVWVLEKKSCRLIELMRSRGVPLDWQTRDYFEDVRTVDVCNSTGLWITCSVKNVTDNEITVEFPWWSSKYVIGPPETKTFVYPSIYIAPAGDQAHDWRSQLQLGTFFRYRLDEMILYVKIVMESDTDFTVMHYVDGELFVLPRELRDTTFQQFGPDYDNYIVNKGAIFSFNRLQYTDCTTSMHVVYDLDLHYNLPAVQLTPLVQLVQLASLSSLRSSSSSSSSSSLSTKSES